MYLYCFPSILCAYVLSLLHIPHPLYNYTVLLMFIVVIICMSTVVSSVFFAPPTVVSTFLKFING